MLNSPIDQPIDEEIVREYCQHHILQRPNINICKALLTVILVNAVVCAVSYALCLLVGLSFFLCFDLLMISIAACFASTIMKFLIKCYQHYASEITRRQCSCMPSCSEYALLALEKYNWPKALWKIWRRVTHTCSMPGYHIDYP